ncbi:MAG: hypothetical protein WCF16_08895 [Alphaproteobacteria bacterium]
MAASYRRLLGSDSPDGRLVMADLARYCRVHATSFAAGDPHQTAFNEGARDAFLHIAEMAGLSPQEIDNLEKQS